MTDGLTEFLNARLDEDEEWAANPECDQDPARVLREAEAKRAILGRHKPLEDASGDLSCAWCSDDVDTASLDMRWPCPDVRDLAAIWEDHPDYRPEWKP